MIDEFKRYSHIIENLSERSDTSSPVNELLLWENIEKKLTCFYAPFEYCNKSAELILVGITPGRTQMNRGLTVASQEIKNKNDFNDLIYEVKKIGSFSGAMRTNIVNILNRLNYHKRLGIENCSKLWDEENHRIHFCSILKYPVFVNNRDYNGNPNPLNVPELKNMIMTEFVNDLNTISKTAIIVPLGDLVAKVITELDDNNFIPQSISRFEGKIVAPPHPSGANAESIALFVSDEYPEKNTYLEVMYQKYLVNRSWEKKKNGKPQSEEKYKIARSSRWESMNLVRRAYNI